MSIIQKVSRPIDQTSLRSILAIAEYYLRFIRNFARILHALYSVTSSKVKFYYINERKNDHKSLKQALTEPSVLGLTDFHKQFVVETDVFSFAMGAFISQVKLDGSVHPIQYASHKVKACKKTFSLCEREALAVSFALK